MNDQMATRQAAAEQAAQELLAALANRSEASEAPMPLATVQALLAALVKAYAGCLMAEDESEDVAGMEVPSPFPSDHPVTATEVLIIASGMLRAVNLNVFELGLWENIGRYR